MRPIRVLYVIGGLARGGAEKQLFLLLQHLDRQAFEPTVVSLSAGGAWAGPIRAQGIRVIELPRRRSFELGRLARLWRLVRQLRPDILQTFLFSDNVYGLLAGRLAGVPVLVASRRIDQYGDSRSILRRLNGALVRSAHAVICNAHRSLEHVPDTQRARHVVIPNGVELDPPRRPRAVVRAELGLPLEAPVVGNAARLVAGKNHHRFLEVAAAVLARHPGAHFVLAGGGPLYAELGERRRQLGLDGRVHLLGERGDVPDLLGALDVFLLTSDREGMSNTTMEAMAAGLPCVVTDAGGTRELVVHGATGFVCASGQAAEMAERVGELLDDPTRRRRLGEQGRARVAAEFSPGALAESTAALYRRLLGPAVPAPAGGLAPAEARR